MIGNKAIIVTDFKTGERQNAFIATWLVLAEQTLNYILFSFVSLFQSIIVVTCCCLVSLSSCCS